MKNFFEYDGTSPQERKERFEEHPELSRFYIALSEELSHEEYTKFFEAEKQSYFSTYHYPLTADKKKPNPKIKWIH